MTDTASNIVAFPGSSGSSRPAGQSSEKAAVIPIGGGQTITLDTTCTVKTPLEPLELSDLWSAINEKRVRVHYQPQFDFNGGRTVAAEALMRIVDVHGATLLPARFLKQAEHSAMIVPLGRAVIGQVCGDIERWRANGINIEHVAINLSAQQMNVDQSLVAFVERCATQHGLNASDLAFELSERQFLDCNEAGVNRLYELAEYGADITLDDFGVGYLSLAYLSDMPVNTVKFDRSLINRIPRHRAAERVIRHLAAMARDLGARVVAEGIETWDQHDFLSASGCHLGQGFLFAEPMPEADLVDFVRCAERN